MFNVGESRDKDLLRVSLKSSVERLNLSLKTASHPVRSEIHFLLKGVTEDHKSICFLFAKC